MQIITGRLLPALAVLLLFTLAGCATGRTKATPDAIAKLTPVEGVFLASYARNSPSDKFSTESIYLRQIGRRKWYQFGIHSLPFTPLNFDFSSDEGHGSLVVMKLPAGTYEIYDFSLTQDTIGGSIMISADSRFSIPFTVHPGAVSYFGELKIERIRSARFLGIPGADRARFEITDQSERDIALFRQFYPSVTLEIKNVKPSSEHTTPLIRIE